MMNNIFATDRDEHGIIISHFLGGCVLETICFLKAEEEEVSA